MVFALLVAGSLSVLASENKLPLEISLFDFVLISIATFRLIHLVVYDSITNFIRDFFGEFEKGPAKSISNLIHCPWCTGIWAAFIIIFFYFLTSFAWYPILIIAVAGIGTFIQITANRIRNY